MGGMKFKPGIAMCLSLNKNPFPPSLKFSSKSQISGRSSVLNELVTFENKRRSRNLHGVTKGEERKFWKSYLRKFSFVMNVHDYWKLLDFIYGLLGKPISGEKILEVGCGIENYATLLLIKLMYRLRQNLIVPSGIPYFSYVGVDFIKGASFRPRRLRPVSSPSLVKEIA